MLIKVGTDMFYLTMTPTNIPSHIRQQIDNDIRIYFCPNGIYRFHERKPHVPIYRKICEHTIDYSGMPCNVIMDVKQIPGDNMLWLIEHLLTPAECKELIIKANSITNTGDNRSWHPPATGGYYMRVIMVDRVLADELWSRIKNILPKTLSRDGREYSILYINDHFRFSRYIPGGRFNIHNDGVNFDNGRPELTGGKEARSLFTLNIFLNSDEEPYNLSGGGTTFYNGTLNNPIKRVTLKPKPGRAALFWAKQPHEGNLVKSGYKYLLRTDVMCVEI